MSGSSATGFPFMYSTGSLVFSSTSMTSLLYDTCDAHLPCSRHSTSRSVPPRRVLGPHKAASYRQHAACPILRKSLPGLSHGSAAQPRATGARSVRRRFDMHGAQAHFSRLQASATRSSGGPHPYPPRWRRSDQRRLTLPRNIAALPRADFKSMPAKTARCI